MGSLFEPDVQEVTSRTELPAWLNNYGQWLTGSIPGMANRPYVPYEGQMFEGFNPMQQSAFGSYDVWGNMGLPALGGSYNALSDLSGAMMMGNVYDQLLNFNPGQGMPSVSAMMVDPASGKAFNADAVLANRGAIRDVEGGSYLDKNIDDYINPYTQAVIQQTTDEMNRGRQIQLQQQNASQHAAGAFGGSRHGVADSLTNAEFFRNSGNMANIMNQQAYQAATGLMGDDLARALNANLANQGMDWNVQNLNANLGTNTNQFNAGQQTGVSMQNAAMANQVGLGNAGNALRANLANADYGYNGMLARLHALQAAGNLGQSVGDFTQRQGVNLQNFGMPAIAGQLGAGNQQQQFGQQQLDEYYRQWLEARDWQAKNFGIFGPMGTGVQSSQAQIGQQFGPSKGGQLMGLIGTGIGAYYGGPAGAAIGNQAGTQAGGVVGKSGSSPGGGGTGPGTGW